MTIPELMIAIATRLKAVEIAGLDPTAIHYPPANLLPITPALMIRQRREAPATITRSRAAGQVINVDVELVVLVKASTSSPRDEARLDTLIAPIVDAFDPDATGQDIGDMLGVDSSEIDHVWNDVTISRVPVEWAGTDCYAAYIVFDSVIRHRPVAAIMRG